MSRYVADITNMWSVSLVGRVDKRVKSEPVHFHGHVYAHSRAEAIRNATGQFFLQMRERGHDLNLVIVDSASALAFSKEQDHDR